MSYIDIIVFFMSILAAVIFLTHVVVNIFSDDEKTNKETLKDNKKHEKTNKETLKDNKKHKNNKKQKFYSSTGEKPNYYKIGFYYKPHDAFVYRTDYKDGSITYTFVKKDGDYGSLGFDENKIPTDIYFLNTFMEMYKTNGKIFTPPERNSSLRYIHSDLFLDEDYEYSTKTITFYVFDRIHNKNNNNNSSNGDTGNNKSSNSGDKSKVVNAFKFFGFTKVVGFTEVKKAFKQKAMIHHPDKGGDPEKMKEVNTQFEILKTYFAKFD